VRRLFSCLNAFSLALLVVAAMFGYFRQPQHMVIGLFADLGAVFALCLSLALFIGAAKLVKEHVGRYNLDLELVERLNRIYHPFLATVLVCTGLLVVVGVLGGALLVYPRLGTVHGVLAVLGILAYGIGALRISRFQARLSDIVSEVEDRVPESESPGVPATAEAREGFVPDVVDWTRNSTRGRAWMAAGATILVAALHVELVVTALGWLWAVVGVLGATLLGVGVGVSRGGGRADSSSPGSRAREDEARRSS